MLWNTREEKHKIRLIYKTQSYTKGAEFMFEKISFYISGNRIEVADQSFLLGELTTDILDIRPDEFDEMYTLRKKYP